jgi:hypothetical protein
LGAIFEGFEIHPPTDYRGVLIQPVIHNEVARAILFENRTHAGRETQPLLMAAEPPPMKWLAPAVENPTYAHE